MNRAAVGGLPADLLRQTDERAAELLQGQAAELRGSPAAAGLQPPVTRCRMKNGRTEHGREGDRF